MPKIHLTTFINAPIERVFDLSRSISLHTISTAGTNERAIAGVITGLISKGETVTWEARHLFKTRRFTARISAMESPHSFTDEMIKGDFESFRHEHHFKSVDNGTIMIDLLEFESPYAVIGKIFNTLYLRSYLEKFLAKRNAVIKEYAESQKWKAILS
ncbi:MAG TPA: SRPBCC family protein [Ferruginibacter sp.]|jgi:ligand-binding SRPBCC domain-containing protein|nr:SRPBCC family protein [Ferruginibacter sp.]HQR01684.1 SRPBCC family protein [Ferruginibacter sp.]